MATGMMIELFEPATDATFHEQAYLAANPDVRSARVEPRRHFEEHGRGEGRRQFNREVYEPGSSYRTEKFARFQPLLDLPLGGGKTAAFVREGSFPVTIGKEHFAASDYVSESANAGFGPFVEEVDRNPQKNYLDLGCGLRPAVQKNCLYLEVYPSVTADLIVDPDCTYPIRSSVLDGIGCFAVLEHVTKPWLVVDEIHRMLRPGGRVFIDWPFLQPVHGYPSHYFNATRKGLMSMFSDKFVVEYSRTFPNQTPDWTINWILGKFIRDLPSREKQLELMNMKVKDLLEMPPGGQFWKSVLAGAPDSLISEFACGNSLVGTKRG
jgi:SAM-dependent methyltransferase